MTPASEPGRPGASPRDARAEAAARGAGDGGRRWLVTLAVMLVASMQVLDSTVTNVALPHMQGSLSASVDEITWVFTSFLAANAVVLPATGWLMGLLGRRRFFFTATLVFLVASLISGAAPTLPVLLGARLLQGLGGGPLIPLSQAILMEVFPPRERSMAMAIWGLGIMLAPIAGPTLGGWLTEQYSWRWIFYLNLPIGVVALAVAWLYLHDTPASRPARVPLDGVGLALMLLGVGGLQVALDRGERLDWFDSTQITVLLTVGVVATLAFVVRELRTPTPLVDLRVLANRTFALGTGLITFLGFGLYSSFVLLAIYLGTVLRYDAWTVGEVMAPGGLGSLISLLLVGRLGNRLDPRILVTVGSAVIAYSLFLMAELSLAVDFWTVLVSRFVQGLGTGLVFVPLTTMSLAVVAPSQMATATGIFNLVRNLGASIGIAVLTTRLSRQGQVHHSYLAEHATSWNPATGERLAALERAFRGSGVDAGTARDQALQHLAGEVQRQATMQAFVDNFTTLAWLFVLFVPLVWGMARPRHPPEGATELAEAIEPA